MAEIKTVTLKNGQKRYRFVVDIGQDPVTKKRQQKTFTFDRMRDARAELARITSEVSTGKYVRPTDITLDAWLDEWLPRILRGSARKRNRALSAATARNYVDALRPARERLGHKKLQAITSGDVEKLVTWMATEGRRRGGKAGTGLSGRSVALTLGRLTAALEAAVKEGRLVRNPAALVEPPPHEPRKRSAWSPEQVQGFLAVATQDRLHAAWRLSLYGLRRGEVLGLRWDAVTWGPFAEPCPAHREKWCAGCYVSGEPATIRIDTTRVLVEYQVVIKDPKSTNGKRVLPLDVDTAAALRALRVQQHAEKLAAGNAYADSGWVVVDEIGEPVHPEWFSDEFGRVSARAGLPRIVLHEARHTTLSVMANSGVPISIVSAWAGHHDPAFTLRQYVHAGQRDLAAGAAALGKLYKVN